MIHWKDSKGSFMNFSSELILVFSSHKAVILLQMTWNKLMSHINFFLMILWGLKASLHVHCNWMEKKKISSKFPPHRFGMTLTGVIDDRNVFCCCCLFNDVLFPCVSGSVGEGGCESDGFSVDHLERVYSVLSQCIYQHRRDYDKTRLIEVEWRTHTHTDQYVVQWLNGSGLLRSHIKCSILFSSLSDFMCVWWVYCKRFTHSSMWIVNTQFREGFVQ